MTSFMTRAIFPAAMAAGLALDTGFDIGSAVNASIASGARIYGPWVRLGYSW